uniref:ATP synthase F0 subunit 8 n=1 Tax=Encarsia obtusiclava TaxID=2358487 RepID=A0A386T9V4_9HYME|nr:ATP synthase F0 subunit 8 [Encarsia obtusiclava]
MFIPQMSPLLWLILYIYFILLFVFINILIYYFFFNFKKNNLKKSLFLINLKWLW